jgi:small subunit ribosomal protein S8
VLKNLVGKNMTDPITDMINRIRNAQAVDKTVINVPNSKIKIEILKVLQKMGWVKDFKVKIRNVEVELGERKVLGAKRISKPGQRIYASHKDIKRVRDGFGIAVISTSRGLVTDREARREKLGGEVLLQIW